MGWPLGQCALLLILTALPFLAGKPDPQMAAFMHNISFIHIPKNGGSKMENIILAISGFSVGFQSFKNKRMNGNQWHVNSSKYCSSSPPFNCNSPLCANGGICAYWHVPPYTYLPPYHPWLTKGIRFCHIRNPFTRAISELFFSHHGLTNKPVDRVVDVYLPLLKALSADKKIVQEERRATYYSRFALKTDHACHNLTVDSLSPPVPSVILPFPDESGCYLNPHEHCHNIPESRFVEPYVTADYMQDLLYYLSQTEIDCYEILRILEEKHSTESTRGTGVNCNFPLRTDHFYPDLDLLLQRCGPLPEFVQKGRSSGASAGKNTKYLQILRNPEVKSILQELFWEDIVRFGFAESPI